MNRLFKILIAILATLVIAVFVFRANPKHEIMREAYIYGYPLITFDMARRQQTNVAIADNEHAPMGQVIKMRSYPAAENHCCSAPNTDTLYTIIWLDVTEEPWVVSVPEMRGRYYLLPMLDGWSEVFHVVSSSSSGGKAQSYAITGPGWTGTLPPGVVPVQSDTGMVWILGRIYSDGTPEDYETVHALQDQFVSIPLSAYGKSYSPPPGEVEPDFDMKTSVRQQVNQMPLEEYFTYLARLMKTNPPKPSHAMPLERLAKIGLVPGQDLDSSKLPLVGKRVAPKMGLVEMGLHLKKQKTTNGWLYFTKGVGNFGDDYLTRGMANLLGPGWNRPQDAIYPLSMKDASGHDYDGSKQNYVIRFEKGQLPPAEAFWSVTLYDKNFFFVPNAINRYSLAKRDPFKTNADGSVEIYIQAESPGKGNEANWLPAPKGNFVLVMRIYEPSKTPPSILDGSWTPPPVNSVP